MTAALLHDVIDDTRVDITEVEAAFGLQTATLVATVTRLSQMNQLMRRKARKAREQVHLQKFGSCGQKTSGYQGKEPSFDARSMGTKHMFRLMSHALAYKS